MPILIPLAAVVTSEDVLRACDAPIVLVADCYVAGCESWTPAPWGWETTIGGRTIVNVDHHSADQRFYRHVSSGNLAIEYRRAHTEADAVVINHTDCDSVISCGILSGLLAPKECYGQAVIAADHVGAYHPIADLLQAMDSMRDFGCSLRNLELLENGLPLEPAVEPLLADRRRERAMAFQLVSDGAFDMLGGVAFATLPGEQRVSGEFLPPLLRGAWVIVSGTPMSGGLWETKIRLGLGAPEGLSLFRLGVMEAEPCFGGRWNAGSTKRAGGSPVAPREVAMRLAERIKRFTGA